MNLKQALEDRDKYIGALEFAHELQKELIREDLDCPEISEVIMKILEQNHTLLRATDIINEVPDQYKL